MDMTEYVATLRREMAAITRIAGEDVARTAEMLTDAMESAVRLTLLEVVSGAAAEITTRLDDIAIDVRLSGTDADFVVTVADAEPAAAAAEAFAEAAADDVTRVTLRMSEQLKARVEAAASTTGVSVNAWLVRAISEALDPQSGRSSSRRPGIGQRVTGYARS
jgi:hypothetical protein